jgi:general secretion pathway protein F
MAASEARLRPFDYRALDRDGATRSGIVQAEDEGAAARLLLQQGLTPIVLQGGGAAAAAAAGSAARGRLGAADRIAIVQELATLLGAGVSLGEALPSLAEAYAAQIAGPALAGIDRAVRGGQTLSAALAASPLALPPYVLALTQAGEASGELATALRDAAAQMDYERRAAQELKNALIYPAVLVSAGVIAVSIIFIGVVPRFAGILKSSRADVPALSRAVIEAGLFVKAHLGAFGFGAALLALLLAALLGNPRLRAALFDALARAPVLGDWLQKVELGRWTTVFGQLLANRVPLIDAITLSTGALRLKRLRDDLASAPRELERGRALSDILAGLRWFPANRLNLVKVGERSGELPRMLATLGEVETEAARTLQKRVLALIEPAAIIVIGAVIGVVMVAVMMAITSLNTVSL